MQYTSCQSMESPNDCSWYCLLQSVMFTQNCFVGWKTDSSSSCVIKFHTTCPKKSMYMQTFQQLADAFLKAVVEMMNCLKLYLIKLSLAIEHFQQQRCFYSLFL